MAQKFASATDSTDEVQALRRNLGNNALSLKRRFLRRTFDRPNYTSKSSIAASKAVSISKSHITGLSSCFETFSDILAG